MEDLSRKEHWEDIYESGSLEEASWYQSFPATSLQLIQESKLPQTAKIIDIGAGDSLLVDHLLDLGYVDVSVLDISENAISKAKARLGRRAAKVKWIIADAASFMPVEIYDLWHDRATFHFLTRGEEIANYMETAYKHLSANGVLIIGTFSEIGPKKCSGLKIKQYSEKSMATKLKGLFTKQKCIQVDHFTPAGSKQNFIFCVFTKTSA